MFDWVGSVPLDEVLQSRTIERNGKENLCLVIARRARYSNGESPKSVGRCAKPAVGPQNFVTNKRHMSFVYK